MAKTPEPKNPVATPGRVIMRIELTAPAKQSIQEFAEHAGMTQFAIASRLVEWFAEQPETIKSVVLRRYPAEIEADVAKLLLRRMAAEQTSA